MEKRPKEGGKVGRINTKIERKNDVGMKRARTSNIEKERNREKKIRGLRDE